MEKSIVNVLILRNCFHSKSERDQYIIKYLKKIYGMSDEIQIQLHKDGYGKPYLTGCNLFCSISHSGKYVCVALFHREIGIDIEEKKTIDFEKIMSYLFTEQEKLCVNHDISKFYDVWVKKESFSKMLGKGLLLPFNSFCVEEEADIILKKIDLSREYIGYLCYAKSNEMVDVRIWFTGDMMNE